MADADPGVTAEAPAEIAIPDNWTETLPETIRAHPSMSRVLKPGKDGILNLANSFVQAQDFIGADRAGRALVMPKDDAPPEETSAFFERLGRPAAADKYEYKPPEGAAVDEGFLNGFREAAFDAGLNATQWAKLTGWYNDQTVSHFEGLNASRAARVTETETELRTEFKDGYDQHKALARSAASKIGIDDEAMADLEGVLGGAKLIKALAAVGRGYAEDGSAPDGRARSFAMTATEAKSETTRLMSDPNFRARWTNRGPGHDEAVAEIQRLNRIATG